MDLEQARIELFTTLRLGQILLEGSHAEPDFMARSYAVLRPHVDTIRRNRWLRGIQSQGALRWETGKPPTDNGEMMLVSPQDDIADTLRDMAPHARRLLMELQHRKRYWDFPVLLAFFDLMRRWGADPDESGTLRMLAGSMAEGPEISIEDAIRVRHAFQPANRLDLRGLTVSDDALAAVPETVSGLALVNSSVTDAGIPHLMRLTGLKRLNIAGTQITDDGLIALGALQDLEWGLRQPYAGDNRRGGAAERNSSRCRSDDCVRAVVGTGRWSSTLCQWLRGHAG